MLTSAYANATVIYLMGLSTEDDPVPGDEAYRMSLPANAGLHRTEIEISFDRQQELADPLIINLFTVLPQIDMIVQDQVGTSDDYNIVWFDITGDDVKIQYEGNKANTQIDVQASCLNEKWYLVQIGLRSHDPPLLITTNS